MEEMIPELMLSFVLNILNIAEMKVQRMDRNKNLSYRQAQWQDHKDKGNTKYKVADTLHFNIDQKHAQDTKQKAWDSVYLHIPDQQKPAS